MPNKNRTHISVVLDRSGSMSSISDAVISGFNDDALVVMSSDAEGSEHRKLYDLGIGWFVDEGFGRGYLDDEPEDGPDGSERAVVLWPV